MPRQGLRVLAVPVYYVPLAAIESGPGEITKENKDGSGFWTGSIASGNQTAEVTGYDKGSLEGFVKIRVTDAGSSSAQMHNDGAKIDLLFSFFFFAQNGLPRTRSS